GRRSARLVATTQKGSSGLSVPSHPVRARRRPPEDNRPLLALARYDARDPLLPLGLADAHHRDRRMYCRVREPRSDTEASDFLRVVYPSLPHWRPRRTGTLLSSWMTTARNRRGIRLGCR